MNADQRSRLRALRAAATQATEGYPWRGDEGDIVYDEDPAKVPRGYSSQHIAAQVPDADVRAYLLAMHDAFPALLDALDAAEARATTAEMCVEIRNGTLREMRGAAERGAEAYLRMTERAEAAERERDEARDERNALRAQTLVAVPLGTLDPRGLPCACDEWGPGHLAGCPNGSPAPATLDADPRDGDGREVG